MKAIEQNFRRVTPYVPGEQPKKKGIVKLNTNENPYPPAPGVLRALAELSRTPDALRRYPDPAAQELVQALAASCGVGEDQIFPGVGSDDVLAIAFQTFFQSGRPVLFPDITYSFYPVWAQLFGVPYRCPALDGDFRMRREDYYGENGGILFPNPNAPTAIAEPLSFVEDILRHNPDTVVIVDEAYVDFGSESAIRLLPEYENLLVVQTFSKSRSLAGMRIGYAVGSPLLIRYMNAVKYSYNSYTMSAAAIRCGVEAVKDEAYFRETTAKIVATRERTARALKELGFVVLPSSANFLFASHPQYPGRQLYQALREADIYVRYFDAPRIDNYLRISVGTDGEMEQLLGFLASYTRGEG